MVIADDCLENAAMPTLLARAREGDADAFCLLVEPLQSRLLRQALALCGDPATAEDLASETLIQGWKSLRSYNETCRLSTWLYGILLHRHQKHIRKSRRWPLPLSWLSFTQAGEDEAARPELPAAGSSPTQSILQDEVSQELRRAIDALPHKHREVILLRFFEEAALADMAALLGCSMGTVKSRLHHALEKLRKMNLNLSGGSWDTPA